MVGVLVDPGLVIDEDDRRSIRSTSTVASTVGTGVISLASRMAALAIDFSDKFQEGDNSILEEDAAEEDGTRSERTVNTVVDDGDADGGGDNPDDEFASREPRPVGGSLHGTESPDHAFAQRLPFQICSHLFLAKGNVQLKRINIGQVEELRQHGYVVVDNFISRELAVQVKAATLLQYNKGRMMEAPRMSGIGLDATHRSGDMVLPLVIGKPPADSTPLALLLVALQELYEDLHEFTRLRRPIGEYQVALHLPNSSGVPRHKDALPDSGRKRGRRRVTCMVCCNTDYHKEDGGVLSIWPPRSMSSILSGGERQATGRRSLASSDAGTSFTESDTCSLRSHYTGVGGGYMAGSISSSMWAEAASAVDPRDDGNDNASITGSVDGYAVAAASYAAGLQGSGLHYVGPHVSGLQAAGLQASALPGSAAALAMAEARALAWSAALGGPQAAGAGASSTDAGSSGLGWGGSGVHGGGEGGAASASQGLEWVEQDGEMVLEVAPLPGRLIIFLAGAVDHAHQPVGATSELVSVTSWYQ